MLAAACFLDGNVFRELLFDEGGQLTRGAGLKVFDDFGFDPDLDLAAAARGATRSFASAAAPRSFLFRLFHGGSQSELELVVW